MPGDRQMGILYEFHPPDFVDVWEHSRRFYRQWFVDFGQIVALDKKS